MNKSEKLKAITSKEQTFTTAKARIRIKLRPILSILNSIAIHKLCNKKPS